MRKIIVMCSVAVTSIGLMAWVYGADARQTEVAASSADSTLVDELQRLRSELQRAHQQTAAVERRLALLESRSTNATVAQDAIDEPSSEPETRPPTPSGVEDQQPKFVERVFQAEIDDPQWRIEPELRARFRELAGTNSSIQTLDCRSSLCRVEIFHNNGDAYSAFAQAMMMPQPSGQRLWSGAMFSASEDPRSAGAVRETVYLVRTGHQMPVAPE